MPDPVVVIWENLMRGWYEKQNERQKDDLIDKA